ncbi:MAG: hypothetical protein ACO372_02995 [Methylophilaceae bacterium]
MAIANKHNFGYISPADFNLYAKQAQLDLFENYFYRYNDWINKQNARVSGSGYADAVKNLEEVIDTFSVEDALYKSQYNNYLIPNEDNNTHPYYLLNKVMVYQDVVTDGVTDGVLGGNAIVDSTKDFVSLGVSIGDYVGIQFNDSILFLSVTSLSGNNTLFVDSSIINASGKQYSIYKYSTTLKEAERVSHSKISMLNASNLTGPKINTPAYTQSELTVSLHPNTIDSIGQVRAQYIRKPKDPKWTYTNLSGGEPAFDQGSSDYQDFELPASDEPRLISKILQYVGISIREADVYQAGTNEEVKTTQKQG